MSFLYCRGKIYWYGTSINGKRIRQSLHVRNRRQAEILQSELDLKYARAGLGLRHIEDCTISEYFQIYSNQILHIKCTNRHNSWGYRMLKMLQNFVDFAESRVKWLRSIDRGLIKDYILMRRENGRSAKTIREELAIVRRFLQEAVRDNHLAECSIDFRSLQKELIPTDPPNHFPPFTEKEMELIFSSGSPDVPFFKVLFYTGLRRSDVGRLTQRNLDRKRHCIAIVTQKETVPVLIPIHPEIEFLLKIKTEYLFPDYVTEAQQDACRKRLKRLGQKLNINPRCNLHSFRHTFNQRLFELGLSYEDRRKLMAHSSSRSTEDYTHADLGLSRKYIEKL